MKLAAILLDYNNPLENIILLNEFLFLLEQWTHFHQSQQILCYFLTVSQPNQTYIQHLSMDNENVDQVERMNEGIDRWAIVDDQEIIVSKKNMK